ncbi:MAG: FCD domain-containing protein [Actinobacteria bacterium]|nr:FCD domain-containing protein [Actinomycetota bacterium]
MKRLNRRPLLAEEIAASLRTSILNGDLRPGQKIAVAAIARDMEVSHIPVREAIQRLEAESLVTTIPHQGPVVADVNLEDLHDIYLLRRLIEGDAARRAASLYSDADIARIRDCLEKLLDADPQFEEGGFWDAHRAFHHAILQPAGSAWSARILNLLWQSAERYHRLYTLVFGSLETAHDEHRALAEAAAARDGEKLYHLLTTHLMHTEEVVTNGYREVHPEIEHPEKSSRSDDV